MIKIRITAKSYFSGAGGMDLGLIQAGIDVIESFEIDEKCCSTLTKNFRHKVNQTDITTITVLDQPEADIYVGTFPCTRYSTAADISKTRTGDDLFLHFFRHIALAKPEMYIVVNANMWLPQERKRLIVIGTKKPFGNLEYPESKQIGLKDIVEKDAEIDIPQYVLNRINGKYRDKPIISDPDNNDNAPTCVAHYAKDVGTRLVKDGKRIRPYTVREYGRLQGFPDWFEFSGTDRDAYRQIGNAVAVPMGEWIGRQAVKYFNGRRL